MSTSESQNIQLPEIKIYHRKSTSESQNISPEVDFRKSKYITGSRLPKVKIYHRKSTSETQKSLPEVNFRKSKIITGNRLPKVKKHYESRLPYINKIIYFILFYFLKHILKSRKHINLLKKLL